MPFTLVINAGGESRRMGMPKALLALPPQQTPLLRHILHCLQQLADRTLIIANQIEIVTQAGIDASIGVYSDIFPNSGTLGGISTGLRLCADWAIIVACDMPFVDPALFRYLQQLASEKQEDGTDRWDAVVPRVNGFSEPLHALYHRRCLPHLEQRLQNGERRANCFYPDVRVRYVEEDELRLIDPDLRSFINVNTPEEWQHVLQNLLKKH